MKFLKKPGFYLSLMIAGFANQTLAIEGQAGLDLTLSDETGRIGLYSMRESEVELTNLGVDYFFNEPKDSFLSLNGSVSRKGIGGSKNLELGVKGQLFYMKRDRNIANASDARGLMLGVTGRYWLPANVPLAVAGDFLYSPRIVTGGDANYATETNLRGEVRILPSALAYVGFRQLSVEFPGGTYELDKNVHVGVKVAIQ